MDTDTETVHEENEPTGAMDQALDQATEEVEAVEDQEVQEQEQMVPLAALQKERKKRQEETQRARLLEELHERNLRATPQAAQEEDETQYQYTTRKDVSADLSKKEAEILRAVDERSWIRQFPEKKEEIDQNLETFLKQRPHLKYAIEAAPNRYEEAWTLMNALSPKQKASLKAPPAVKKAAPGSPSSVPKAAGLNQAIDVMSMTDSEYREWRNSKRRGR